MNSTDYYKTRKCFTPTEGCMYENEGGGLYLCLISKKDMRGCGFPFDAVMQSQAGWVFIAHNIGIYEDGRIDWAYSTGGHFIPKEVSDET